MTNYYQHRKINILYFDFHGMSMKFYIRILMVRWIFKLCFYACSFMGHQNLTFEWYNKYFMGFPSFYFAWSYVLIDHKQVIITKLFTYLKLFELNRGNAKFWLRNYHTIFCCYYSHFIFCKIQNNLLCY